MVSGEVVSEPVLFIRREHGEVRKHEGVGVRLQDRDGGSGVARLVDLMTHQAQLVVVPGAALRVRVHDDDTIQAVGAGDPLAARALQGRCLPSER